MKSAEQTVLESIDQLLAQQDHELSIPFSTLNQAVTDVVTRNGKVITKLTDRVLRDADKHLTRAGDVLDAVQTTVLQGLDAYHWDQEYLLTQLASKGGLIEAGDPLTKALVEQAVNAPELAYAGTLVLAVKEAIPWLERLTESLDGIRRRLPVQPTGQSIYEGIPPLNLLPEVPYVDGPSSGEELLRGLLESSGDPTGALVGVIMTTPVSQSNLDELERAIQQRRLSMPEAQTVESPGARWEREFMANYLREQKARLARLQAAFDAMPLTGPGSQGGYNQHMMGD